MILLAWKLVLASPEYQIVQDIQHVTGLPVHARPYTVKWVDSRTSAYTQDDVIYMPTHTEYTGWINHEVTHVILWPHVEYESNEAYSEAVAEFIGGNFASHPDTYTAMRNWWMLPYICKYGSDTDLYTNTWYVQQTFRLSVLHDEWGHISPEMFVDHKYDEYVAVKWLEMEVTLCESWR